MEKYTCGICDKMYMNRSGLHKHKKKCLEIPTETVDMIVDKKIEVQRNKFFEELRTRTKTA